MSGVCCWLATAALVVSGATALAANGQTVRIGVIDANGALVPNATVRWLEADGGSLHATVQSDGTYLLKGVTSGKGTVDIDLSDRVSHAASVLIPSDKAVVSVLVHMTASGPRVEFADANALDNLPVANAKGTSLSSRRAFTRSSRRFQKLAAGRSAGDTVGGVAAIAACSGAAYGNSDWDAGSNALANWRSADNVYAQWIVDDVSFAGDITINEFHWNGNDPVGFNWSGQTADYIILQADGAGGTPGTLVTEVSGVAATRVDTGNTLFGDPVWEYSITGLSEFLTAGDYWIGVRPVQDLPLGGGQFDIGWIVTGPDNGTSESYVDYGPNSPGWDPGSDPTIFGAPYQLSFCVVGPQGDAPWGSCCNDVTGACEDCVQSVCPGGRFVQETTCDDMFPACGQALGACCDPVLGTCSQQTPSDCDAAGGLFKGVGVDCADADCPCVVNCPTGATAENEPDCGNPEDTVNGGCNAPVVASNCCVASGGLGCDDQTCQDTVCAADDFCCTGGWDDTCAAEAADLCSPLCDSIDFPYFTDIACGETVCGSGAFDGAQRDTDWYKFEVATETEVTWTVEAEFIPLIGIVDTNGVDDCTLVTDFLTYTVGTNECDAVSVTACLPPGVWYAFVAPDFDANTFVECPADYNATLECDNCPVGACCMGDGSCTELSGPACDVAGGTWSGDGTTCSPNDCPQPPPNDDCGTSLPITVNGASETVDNTIGSDDNTPTCDVSSPNNGVWYTVVGTGNTMQISTCNPGTDFDTKIQVFCDCADFVCVGGNDDADGAPIECDLGGFNRKSIVEFCSEVGKTYYIHVGGFGSAFGNIELTATDDGTACSPAADCTVPTGACCVLGSCVATETQAECEARTDGQWFDAEDCGSFSCPQPITNETCEEATDITSVPYSTSFDNSDATADGPGCDSFYTSMQNDVWFTYTATEDCTLIGTVDPDAGAGYDGVMAIWSGADCNNLTEELCYDDPEPYDILLNATAGTTYWFEIGDYGSSPGGGLTTLDLDCVTQLPTGACCLGDGTCNETDSADCSDQGGTYQGNGSTCSPNPCPQPPDNDNCDGAIDLGSLPATDIVDVTAATDDVTVPCGVSSGPYKDVWYTVVGTGDTLTASTCGAGTVVTDTKISVFCRDCESPVCVGGNDDDCAYLSTVSWCSEVGRTYYITVGLYSGSTTPGDIQLDVTDTGTACADPVDCEPLPDYCSASGGCDEYISNVSVGSIDNDSVCDGYGDYTALSTDLQIGVGTDITVTLSGYGGDEGGLWIDWNQDLDFGDTDETITTAWAGAGPYTETITPPAGAGLGLTRMRVRVLYYGPPSSACGDSTYGDVEDYSVNVLAARQGTGGPWDDDDGDGIPNFCDNSSAIPTVSEWGLIALTLIGLGIGTVLFRRRRLA